MLIKFLSMKKKISTLLCCLLAPFVVLFGQSTDDLLIEAESFKDKGGWLVDQQFVHLMGSPYLIAHGMGSATENATTKINLPSTGTYKVWVRTKDWVPEHVATPGIFKLKINSDTLSATFGTNNGWNWVNGGQVTFVNKDVELTLIDLTGFDGRCDAIYLTKNLTYTPPNTKEELKKWRREKSGLVTVPKSGGRYDLVVVGGGIAGSAAAIAAAREGLTVALIQDRPVLGGNASQEVRVHTLGVVKQKIVGEINTAHYPNGNDEVIVYDERRHQVVEKESKIKLFLSNRAYAVNKSKDNTISSVDIKHIETGVEQRISGDVFIDATGDGWIGYWAGASFMIGAEPESKFNESLAAENLSGRSYNLRGMMGVSLLWNTKKRATAQTFPEVPWATEVSKSYSANRGEWFWEYGIGLNSIDDAEHIRDHLLKAVYGTFSNTWKKAGNENLYLDWVAYIMGKRESRRIVGDYILTQNDIEEAYPFPDGVVTESRAIDIHYDRPHDNYDFLSEAHFHKIPEYTVPFRSLYSKDIPNLMMAGRCLSASHIGLGSPRVMNTTGQMGVAVGYAAYLCIKHNTLPRGVYQDHIGELRAYLGYDVPETELQDHAVIIDNLDNVRTEVSGEWISSSYTEGYYAENYFHDDNKLKGEKEFKFLPEITIDGEYKLYLRYSEGSNRASNSKIEIKHVNGDTNVFLDQRTNNVGWVELGKYGFSSVAEASITIKTEGTDGYVIADALAYVRELPNTLKQHVADNDLDIRISDGQVNVSVYTDGEENIRLEVFDIQGKNVSLLANGQYSNGYHTFIWDKSFSANGYSPGVFILRFVSGKKAVSKKVLLK